MNKNQIIKIKVNELHKADWNYKTDGTADQIEKLANAIKEAGSAGVLAVREIERDGQWIFEVMDGNHRLEAIKLLDWREVPCENFGRISQARAVILTRQRNQNWFEDDKLKLANLFTEIVLPEYDKDFLASILPETVQSLETMELLTNADWQPPVTSSTSDSDDNFETLTIRLPEETYNLWIKWKQRLQDLTEIDSDHRALEFAVIEALNVPEADWTEKS